MSGRRIHISNSGQNRTETFQFDAYMRRTGSSVGVELAIEHYLQRGEAKGRTHTSNPLLTIKQAEALVRRLQEALNDARQLGHAAQIDEAEQQYRKAQEQYDNPQTVEIKAKQARDIMDQAQAAIEPKAAEALDRFAEGGFVKVDEQEAGSIPEPKLSKARKQAHAEELARREVEGFAGQTASNQLFDD